MPPDITFAERVTLTLGGKRFVLLYAGPAHSASDMMMMVEPDGVLFAGDIVQNGRIPHMNSDDVDTGRWLAALKQVEGLKPRFIIPVTASLRPRRRRPSPSRRATSPMSGGS